MNLPEMWKTTIIAPMLPKEAMGDSQHVPGNQGRKPTRAAPTV